MLKQRHVLMLEEDPDDRQISESALKELGMDVPVKYVKYSDELFEQLKAEDKPSLILIDYNATPLPAIDILKALRANEEYRHIPAVVLGEGLPQHLVRKCYEAGANSFVTKPASTKATREKIETFLKYWLDVVETG